MNWAISIIIDKPITMKNIGRRLFLISFIFALIASIAIYFYLKSFEKENEVIIEKVTILVAAIDIPARTKITEDMIKEIEVPREAEFGVFVEEVSSLVDKYTKETIYQNERFHSEKLIEQAQDELTLMIHGDHRAFSLMVNMESGVSDLMRPGDFVDIIVYLPELKEAERIVRPNLSKMILQNIEVLAIDQNLYRDMEPRVEEPTTYFVTLSVPVLEVEKLVLAEDIGDIKLVLRPLELDYIYDTEGVIWEELLLDDFDKMKDMFPQYEIKNDVDNETINDLTQKNNTYDKYYYYTIQYGDTLRSISRKFYADEGKYILLKQVNKIDDENTIVTGTGIKIPVLSEEGEDHE